ncbi:MAG: hypothetical protein HYZ90_05935 [Candidatus Omnitrophica bacterium]|nr:hypothetical protein [Candidatus Omnitrophota bacterium]
MASERLLQKTIEFWQPYSLEPITREKALIIVENVSALLDLLERWAREEASDSRSKLLTLLPDEDGDDTNFGIFHLNLVYNVL